MRKIPCPSCRETNFDTDFACWKCGMPLHKRVPDASSPQTQVAGAHQWDVLVPGHLAVPDRRTTLCAAIIGGIVGAAASLLLHIPFVEFVEAASLPGVLAVPYLVFAALAGAVVGVIAVSVRQGWMIGVLAYIAGGYLFGRYASGSAVLMPPETTAGWSRMHTILIGAGIVAPASVLLALALIRLIGIRGLFPGLLAYRFTYRRPMWYPWWLGGLIELMYRIDRNGDPVIPRVAAGLGIVIAIMLVFFAGGYELITKDQIGMAERSPVTMVAWYTWTASQQNPDYGTLRLFLTSDLTKRADSDPAMRAAMRIPLVSLRNSARAWARSVFVDTGHAVRETYSADRQSADVVLPVDPASGAVAVADGIIREGSRSVLFRVRLEDGKWRISDIPLLKGAQ